jgi:AmmeMemoRadiSam system protein B/AmmeMemoRadiSam system protein A
VSVRDPGEVEVAACQLRRRARRHRLGVVFGAWALAVVLGWWPTGAGVLLEGGGAEMTSSKVREPAAAGGFYPGSEKALRDTVSAMLEKAHPTTTGKIVGLIAPHAGYVYSGQIAAQAYRAVRGNRYDAVILVAPSHHVYFNGSSIYREGRYKTPLGAVDLAADLADAIAKGDPSITSRTDAHVSEHSLEVQLPFLQVAVPGLRIVPIVMGDQSLRSCRQLAKAIAGAAKGKNVLLVASTDLSHFHNYDEAGLLDRVVIERVGNYDPEGLARDLDAGNCEACGGGPVVTVMLAARELGATKAMVLDYANSGDVTGDRSSVVGYLAAALVADAKVGVDLGVGEGDKATLLKLARQSIEANLAGKPAPDIKITSPRLREEMGAFVTLTRNGELRGCIGHIIGTQALYKTVQEMAVAAATEDPRFPPVSAGELRDIAIEISVLTPLRTVSDPAEIEVGRDGIYIEKGFYRGLLLPQVATQYGWDREEFLDHTCLKAGLPAGCWREGATIKAFSAQVFNEGQVLRGTAGK